MIIVGMLKCFSKVSLQHPTILKYTMYNVDMHLDSILAQLNSQDRIQSSFYFLFIWDGRDHL